MRIDKILGLIATCAKGSKGLKRKMPVLCTMKIVLSLVIIKNNADQDSRYTNLALTTKQKQCMKVASKLYY